MLALTSRGQVYSWDSLGAPRLQDKHLDKPVLLQGTLAGKQIVQIACGEEHSLVLTSQGEVYNWNSDSVGQLGLGSDKERTAVLTATAVEFTGDSKIVSVACTKSASLALKENGRVSQIL